MMSKEDELLAKYEQELAIQQQMQPQPSPYAATMFGGQQKQNLIEWELDFKPELEDIERLLRCDILMRDENGMEMWIRNPDKSHVFLNDLGVNDVLRKIRLLVNKGKVLSSYTLEEIRARVRMIEHELRVLIYNNSEQYDIDNDYKINNYSMMVIAVGSLVEDAYRRAMGGEGHRGLNEQRIVSQTEPLMPQGYGQFMPQQMQTQGNKKLHWYNPFSWSH